VTERSYLSIREVLDLLVAEFPDVTISKIRFLESRGLIHPERTPSGYRKFYDDDVERLRWILDQQRENFLPLKVIKRRLEASTGVGDSREVIEASLFEQDCSDPPGDGEQHLIGVAVGAATTREPVDAAAPSGLRLMRLTGPPAGEPRLGADDRTRRRASGGLPAQTATANGERAAATAAASEPVAAAAAVGAPAPSRAPAPPGDRASERVATTADSVLAREPPAGPRGVVQPSPATASLGVTTASAAGLPPTATPSAPPSHLDRAPADRTPADTAGGAGETLASTGARAHAGGAPRDDDRTHPSVPRTQARGRGTPDGAPARAARRTGRATTGSASPPGSADGSGAAARPDQPAAPVPPPRSGPPGPSGANRPAEVAGAPAGSSGGVAGGPSPALAPGAIGALASGASFTKEELAGAAGVGPEVVAELEEYGLVASRMIAGVRCYDEEALVVARLAAGFRAYGIESRHLRAFKSAAERQAGLFAQVVAPYLRQRNPASRERAHASLADLAGLGSSLQAALVRAELRDLTGG